MNVTKHDGRNEDFHIKKIIVAVEKAAHSVYPEKATHSLPLTVAGQVLEELEGKEEATVNEIHDIVENALMKLDEKVAKAYILYRQQRTNIREAGSELNKQIDAIEKEMHHDNANTGNCAASKMYGIAELVEKNHNLARMNPVHARNHRTGKVYIHDLGYYNLTVNCFFSPLAKMLEKGFDNGVGTLRPPKHIGTAVQLACIILQSAQNDFFGGQGFLHFETDLAPYVEMEYMNQLEEIKETNSRFHGSNNPEDMEKLAMKRTENAVHQAMEAFVANMNTMRSRSGAQVTFSSVNFGTDTGWSAKMISKHLLLAYIEGLGKGENPIFPNLCFRLQNGVNLHKGEPNFDLTELAIECVGKRIQPRFVFCDSPAYPDKWDAGAMGCRTSVRSNVNSPEQSPDARGNLAFNTVNLPMIALEARQKQIEMEKDDMYVDVIDVFFNELEATLEDAANQLYERYQVMKNLKVKDLPFASQWYQGHEGLNENDTIEPMVKNGTLGIGFVGLSECLYALYGTNHVHDLKVQEIGLEIVRRIKTRADYSTRKWSLNFSCFASPAESACHTLLKKTREKFGIIPNVTDKEYFTNSFHVPVWEEVDIKTKIDIEAPYHLLCAGGAIFYVELGTTPKDNPEGLLSILQYMAQSGIVYGGVNWEHNYCMKCGYQGHFEGNCPKCGSDKIKVTAIITGYLSEIFRFNKGKQDEKKDRVSHGGGKL